MHRFLRPFRASGFIFQPNRHLLFVQVTQHAHFVHGLTLDVGCGPMPRYRHLFNKVTKYVKMDIEPGENVDVVGFAEKIPFPDATFDSMVCTEAIQEVFEPMKGFAEFTRVLKKDGVLLLTAPSLARITNSPTDYWRFTPHSLKKMLENTGFEIVVFEQRGAYWSTMAQLNVAYWIRRLRAYGAWYERLCGILASVIGKLAIWMDRLEKGPNRNEFTNGFIVIARKK